MTIASFRRRLVATMLGLCAGAATTSAFAQAGTPLRVILPVGPGSGVDVIARSAQGALSKALGGQPVVIENLAGAGGITGTQALVKAAPDGNTIAFVSNNHAVNPSVFKKMPYDGLTDITPISMVGGSPFVLVVNPKTVPAKNAKELQAFLKAKPDGYNYGSSGNGTRVFAQHLDPFAMEFIDALQRTGGRVSRVGWLWRYNLMTGTVMLAMTDIGPHNRISVLSAGQADASHADELRLHLREYLIRAMRPD